MTKHTRESVENYLDAIGMVHGAEYKSKTEVKFCGSHYYSVKHPGMMEGMVVPAGHLDLMTKHLLEHPQAHQNRF